MLALFTILAQEHTTTEPASDPARFVLPHADELIWGSIAFAILFLLLAKVAFPSINKMLAERQAKIRSGLESAESAKQEADRMLDQYRRQLDEARGDAQKIIDEAKRTAESLRKDLVEKSEREAQEIVARARADVAGERDRAMQALRATVGELSIDLASRVIGRELSQPESQRAFVNQTIEQLARLGDGQGSGNGHN